MLSLSYYSYHIIIIISSLSYLRSIWSAVWLLCPAPDLAKQAVCCNNHHYLQSISVILSCQGSAWVIWGQFGCSTSVSCYTTICPPVATANIIWGAGQSCSDLRSQEVLIWEVNLVWPSFIGPLVATYNTIWSVTILLWARKSQSQRWPIPPIHPS